VAGKTPLKQLAQSGAANGQVIRWNNTTGDWEPSTESVASLSQQFLESAIDSTPNEVVKIYGDGGSTARGLIFASDRTMLRLRVSFKVDSGNNHDVRVRLFKFDAGTVTSILLASIARSNGVDGNPGSNTYHIREQLVSAGPNPGEAQLLANADAIYVVVDRASGAVANGVSQIVISIESESD
jgi:hypothetical protein